VPLQYIICFHIPQPTTDVITDNAVAYGIATDTIKQKRCSVDIHFHWLRDQVRLGLAVHWEEGTKNLADYQTSMSSKDFQEGTILSKVSSYNAHNLFICIRFLFYLFSFYFTLLYTVYSVS
jgi:hypothetical protein